MTEHELKETVQSEVLMMRVSVKIMREAIGEFEETPDSKAVRIAVDTVANELYLLDRWNGKLK